MGFSDKEQAATQDPIVYPKVEGGQQAYETGRWGTYTMGAPSNPQDHPQNKEAATWEPLPSNILDQGEQVRTHNQQASPSSSGYAHAPASGTANPYITTSPAPAFTGKSPMDIIQDYLNKWRQKFEEVSKKAEEAAGNVWQHWKTGPNMADTAWGRLSQGTRLLTEGGFDKIFRQTFETSPDEQLRKSYACYLSTSAGPVAGTLYISTRKIAFCSDRPLSYQPSPGQTAWSYYKVVVPLDRLQAVAGTSNAHNPSEKYIHIQTVDGHDFWFMGFVNYDKALRNLQAAHGQES
ncbi:hypothetical protein GOP47_0009603 [Adiantum capillus-veneris]|uniref:GRAM domain-containing protein n=1 Tax=Adiantum capillus-veneris TaxID=13818 RepID=A0A9D4UXE0_ADICA|nr:hypothetical protein GOP47_0009603 [Adiantum capillus-veneris]